VWTEREGLPQGSVEAITQTRDGYLWVGTRDGLARFDGVAFTVFRQENTPELLANDVRALCGDRAGGLWIGTHGGGLSRYAHRRFTHFGPADGLASRYVWSLAEERRSVLNLRSTSLERGGLAAALNETARQLMADRPVALEVREHGTAQPLPPPLEEHLLHVGQEAITNALKHAHPRRIQVQLAFLPAAVRLSARGARSAAPDHGTRPRFGGRQMGPAAAPAGDAVRGLSHAGDAADRPA
jgi:hypothetical protein